MFLSHRDTSWINNWFIRKRKILKLEQKNAEFISTARSPFRPMTPLSNKSSLLPPTPCRLYEQPKLSPSIVRSGHTQCSSGSFCSVCSEPVQPEIDSTAEPDAACVSTNLLLRDFASQITFLESLGSHHSENSVEDILLEKPLLTNSPTLGYVPIAFPTHQNPLWIAGMSDMLNPTFSPISETMIYPTPRNMASSLDASTLLLTESSVPYVPLASAQPLSGLSFTDGDFNSNAAYARFPSFNQ